MYINKPIKYIPPVIIVLKSSLMKWLKVLFPNNLLSILNNIRYLASSNLGEEFMFSETQPYLNFLDIRIKNKLKGLSPVQYKI